ncbi:RelA/SpoT domain-containing protein [Rhizobium ruizarguesonis]
MAQYPELTFGMQAVRKAGEQLKGKLFVGEDGDISEAHMVFMIANSWRDSHFLPMRSIFLTTKYKLRKLKIGGDMAARPKRMASIRRKLRESSTKLDQMQDIGGCRAILDDIAGVRALLDQVRQEFPHSIRREWPYIDRPKSDGYRSHHVVFHFNSRIRAQDVYEGRRIELQVRTRLQHSWATAVEAVGLFNGEDLKHHHGSSEWLRLFQLVSAEFAHVEGCPVGEGVPERPARIAEIKDLDARLSAVTLLENIRTATHYAENFVYERGKYFLIIYNENHTVEIENFYYPMQVTARQAALERQIEDGNIRSKAVVVEVDKIESLIRTYPNYFGDVGLFVQNLRRIINGKDAQEFTLLPQAVVRPRVEERPDPRLLIRRYDRWN